MMKISEIGKFVLRGEDSKEYALNDGTNLVCIQKDKVFIGNEAVFHRFNADAIFTINFTEDNIILIKCCGTVYVNDVEVAISGYELFDNATICTDKVRIKFKFLCDDLNLEKLIDIFMDGNLNYPLDMDELFYQYAKKIKTTDTKAISIVMAAIDIPEIDKL